MTQKYSKVQKNIQKYIKVNMFFFTGGTTGGGGTKVAKNTQNGQIVPKNNQNYSKILNISHKYPTVPKSTQKYIKVRGDHRFFSQGGPQIFKNTKYY